MNSKLNENGTQETSKYVLTLFAPPKMVKFDDLERTFPKGGTILEINNSAISELSESTYEVYAYIEGEGNELAGGYQELLAQAKEACPEQAEELFVAPKQDCYFFYRPKFYKSEEDFYMDTSVDEACKKIGKWVNKPDEVRVYYTSERRYTPKMGMITAYGVTSLSEQEFIEKHKFPFRISFMTYSEFVSNCKEYMAQKEARKSNASKLEKRIQEFVEQPGAYRLLLNKLNERVLGQEQLHIVAQNVFYWLKGIAKGVSTKNNTILVAPSGCGKTELFRTLKAVLDELIGGIPVSCKDLSLLTTEGFKGADSKYLIADLLQADTNGIGIVMLDEADKKMLPCHSNTGDNVNQDIQGQILTMIEGSIFYEKENAASGKSVDTRNTLFIAAGAFQYIRDKRDRKKSLGFGSVQAEESQQMVTREDMIAAGAMPEFIGRFNSVINFQKLNKESVCTIARRFAEELSEVIGCEVIISERGAEELYERFLTTQMGCRMLKSWIYEPIYEVGNQILLKDSAADGVKVYYHGEENVEVEWPREARVS